MLFKYINLKKILVLMIAASGVCFWPLKTYALEEIIFQNGDKISGDIISYTDGTFHVETNFGPISIPKSEIEKINFNKNQLMTQNAKSITTPDDFLSFIQTSKFSFFVDSEKMNAQNFSNQLRLRWAMKHQGIKSLDEFLEKVAYYSPVTGKHNQVEIEKGRKIKVCDWADSVLKNSGRFDSQKTTPDDENKQDSSPSKGKDKNSDIDNNETARKILKK